MEQTSDGVVEARRGYLRLRRLGARLSDTDRRDLCERAETLKLWAQDAEAWTSKRDGALAECLAWISFTAGALVANWRSYDPARHRAVLLVFRHALRPARVAPSMRRSGSRPRGRV
jgi:hypothetical protein